MILDFCLCFSLLAQATSEEMQIPKRAPQEMPSRLQGDFERGKAGDVFAMIRANQWHPGLPNHYVFPRKLVIEKLEILAKQDNPAAIRHLAHELLFNEQNYRLGAADPKFQEDVARSKKLIERAALLADPEAMSNYAIELWRKNHNDREVITWLLKYREAQLSKAKDGDFEAMNALGGFDFPTDSPVDLATRSKIAEDGLAWRRKAAKAGHMEAAYQLGMELQVRNPKEATKWIEQAANQGHWMAMIQMGRFYAFGFWDEPGNAVVKTEMRADQMPKRNYTKAWEWWDKATALVGWEAGTGTSS